MKRYFVNTVNYTTIIIYADEIKNIDTFLDLGYNKIDFYLNNICIAEFKINDVKSIFYYKSLFSMDKVYIKGEG